MADVFISYKREDSARIQPLAQALERDGYTVWWDLDLVAGEPWASRIKTELDAAKAVIIVWSAASITPDGAYISQWVESEANDAARRNILIPVLFDDKRFPRSHQLTQSANLVGWRGNSDDPGYVRLIAGVERLAGKRSTPASSEVEAWIEAERAQTADDYRAFLVQFPHSRFGVLASARRQELDEAATWATLGDAPSERELKVFLQRYPDGRFAEDAKKRLAKLRPRKLNIPMKRVTAWLGVLTAILTLLVAGTKLWGAFFPKSEAGTPSSAASQPAGGLVAVAEPPPQRPSSTPAPGGVVPSRGPTPSEMPPTPVAPSLEPTPAPPARDGVALRLVQGRWGPKGDCKNPITISVRGANLFFVDAFGNEIKYSISSFTNDSIYLTAPDGEKKTVFPTKNNLKFDLEHTSCDPH